MKVHSTLANGFQEVIYQKCLAMEMQGLKFARELEMEIFYEGVIVGSRRVDFLVERIIMVELKAISKLDELHLPNASTILKHIN